MDEYKIVSHDQMPDEMFQRINSKLREIKISLEELPREWIPMLAQALVSEVYCCLLPEHLRESYLEAIKLCCISSLELYKAEGISQREWVD